ncbi:MAG: anthranilate synthase family protein [Alphaproteobacteria bacterium]|nr:anthranilate synthase family protein [Alphaproteobacteria bacterium]
MTDKNLSVQKFLTQFASPFFMQRKGSDDEILICHGELTLLNEIKQIPLPDDDAENNSFTSINLIPFCQVKERGFAVHDGGEKIKSLKVSKHHTMPLHDFLAQIENRPVTISNIGYDMTFEQYQAIVSRIITDEIDNGQGANFVIPREFTAQLEGDLLPALLSIFRSLLVNEIGSYSTFLFFDGTDYVIGASPERHISKIKGEVMMNPISGTFRKNETDSAHFQEDFFAFLQDEKEIFELLMVVDEELKIMCELCDKGGAIIGPLLKEMSQLVHTEYLLIGRSDKDIHHLLKYSMFAPTVTGSPLENALAVNYRYETQSRGYYSSVIAIIGTDDEGGEMLDAPITIRTLEISGAGKISGRAGATLVRGSDPISESKETEVKISGVIKSLQKAGQDTQAPQPAIPLINQEKLQVILQKRNINLSRFWIEPQNKEYSQLPEFIGKKVVIIDGKDGFSNMLKRIIMHLGADIEWRNYSDKVDLPAYDVVIMGAGPGNPTDPNDEKMAIMRAMIQDLLKREQPFLAVCLSHQILCDILGLKLVKRESAFQGIQKNINLFGKPYLVGFFSSFTGVYDGNAPDGVTIAYDEASNEINALRARHFYSCQFHPESILTPHGYHIVADAFKGLLQSGD